MLSASPPNTFQVLHVSYFTVLLMEFCTSSSCYADLEISVKQVALGQIGLGRRIFE